MNYSDYQVLPGLKKRGSGFEFRDDPKTKDLRERIQGRFDKIFDTPLPKIDGKTQEKASVQN